MPKCGLVVAEVPRKSSRPQNDDVLKALDGSYIDISELLVGVFKPLPLQTSAADSTERPVKRTEAFVRVSCRFSVGFVRDFSHFM